MILIVLEFRTKINRGKFSVKSNTTTVCHVDNILHLLM